MKTFLKLFAAVFVFGFASANAAYTADQKTAAIKAVTDAVATGNATTIANAVSAQVAAFPELAGEIVAAGLGVSGVSPANLKLIVRVAAWTAPDALAAILNGIDGTGLGDTIKIDLRGIARGAAAAAITAGSGRNKSLPPNTLS